VPDIAPEYVVFGGGFRDDPNWGNALIRLPFFLYETYGELDLLEEAYPQMQGYIRYLAGKANHSILDYGLGDWIAFDDSTPTGITATFGYFEALQAMQTIAAALGKTSDQHQYASQVSELLSSFQSSFASSDQGLYSYGSGSQASNAIALDMGVVPDHYRANVTNNILQSISHNGNHLTVGEIALPSLFRGLQSQNQQDTIYRMMTVPTSPSYAYQVLHGATSLTERWDGPTANCHGCNSLNHFMLGYADQWLAELSGLSQRNDSVAWEVINFSPILVTNMTEASSSYRSVRGLASASWRSSKSSFTYNVTVPVGSSGMVHLDLEGLGFHKVFEGQDEVTKRSTIKGIRDVAADQHAMAIEVGSGTYYFRVT
jgi:alpha-L-rhamnosidase